MKLNYSLWTETTNLFFVLLCKCESPLSTYTLCFSVLASATDCSICLPSHSGLHWIVFHINFRMIKQCNVAHTLLHWHCFWNKDVCQTLSAACGTIFAFGSSYTPTPHLQEVWWVHKANSSIILTLCPWSIVLLITNTLFCNLTGLPTFLHWTKSVKSDLTLSFAITY